MTDTIADQAIVKAAIFPPIGIARVGNSPSEYHFGPEVPLPLPQTPGFYRDATGALKREAARFRVYGLNAEGDIVRELTSKDADIVWTVELANKKPAWYQFQIALDIPEAKEPDQPPSALRNVQVADRAGLAILPGPRHVAGSNAAEQRFDTGRFMGTQVYLGSVFTDADGRLVVLGGHGKSFSYNNTPAVTFGNNDTWTDDISDGPVTAKVTLNGVPLPVDQAWVVVAPPNYAPQRKGVRTLWDLMYDVAIQNLFLVAPPQPSFTNDILPIFVRQAGLQWVNQGFAAGFGWQGLFDLTSEAIVRMATANAADKEWRLKIVNQFRTSNVPHDEFADSWAPTPWPWLYGDAMNQPPAKTSRQYTGLTATQIKQLRQWVDGDFVEDYDPTLKIPRSLDDVPVAEQGEALTRAALEFCLADAFHPGCEMTWPVRQGTMYSGVFRFAHAPEGYIEPDYGPVLTYAIASAANGCLGPQVPGGISRWMALPWQTDTASCRSGYDKKYDPYLPTFWPARVPNQVLTKAQYATVVNDSVPLQERIDAFRMRVDWNTPLGLKDAYQVQINTMIAHFDQMGIVEVHPGPSSGPFPHEIEVADRIEPINKPRTHLLAAGYEPPDADLSTIDKVNRHRRR